MTVEAVELRAIRAAETRGLRHAVLRPTERPEDLVFSGDDGPDTLHVGAFVDGSLVGIASFSPERCPGDATSRAWRLQGMAVVPGLQGHGCGRRLLERGIRHVDAHGGTLLWCEGRTNVAGFYRALGFELCGEEFIKPISGPHYIMKRVVTRADG